MKNKVNIFLFHLCSLLWLESIFALIIFESYLRSTIFSIILFVFPIAIVLTILTQLFSKKINQIICTSIYGILGFWFSLELVFKQVFNVFFSLSLFSLSDQVMTFGWETILAIIKNLPYIALFFIPFILSVVLRKYLRLKRMNHRLLFVHGLVFVVTMASFRIYVNVSPKDSITYTLMHRINDNSQNMQNLGVLNATWLDLSRRITGFEEEIIMVETKQEDVNEEAIFEYDRNILDVDFSKGSNETLNDYMMSDEGSKKSKYTGIFEGKNLIYIVAESFHSIGVSKELTPTLYRLTNSGFVFDNFYNPVNLSTIGGEFQALTGLYPNNDILSQWREGTNVFPMGLGNMFTKAGYNTYAYHNNNYTFQDRHQYLKSQGFNNFKACGNGLEQQINCNTWPQSDVEMFDATVDEYIQDNTPFMAYYMSVSGHFGYSFDENAMANKNKDKVLDLDCSESVKGYLATQIELDHALELLINKLEEKGILEDTVIVLQADHYPYDLDINEINAVSDYERDDVVEVNHSNLIIWNSNLKTQEIDKTCMSMDVLPTVYNLFGLAYDSRLLMGKDIFSPEDGIAFFANRSWVSDKGTYFASEHRFVPKKDNVSNEYVDMINQIVANRINLSRLIILSDYYQILSS